MTPDVTLRDARPGDRAGWDVLWQGFLQFYDTTLAPDVTDYTWSRLMDPACPLKMRLAEGPQGLLGFAIHNHHHSTWVMGEDCYLEDLFVAASARGQGIGRAMIEDLQAIARARGWKRLYWHTNSDNTVARRLYENIVPYDGDIRYRLSLT